MKILEKKDRRVQRTRQLLREAVMALIADQGYDSITVQDIIDQANIGRSTFYAHYRDKDDLLISSMDDIVHSLIADVGHASGLKSATAGDHQILCVEPLFQHAKEQFRLHKAIMGGQGIEIIVRKIQTHLSQHIQVQLEHNLVENRAPSVPTPILAYHLASGVMTLLRWWLDNNKPHSPAEMDRIFQEMTMPGVWSILAGNK